MSPKGAQVEGLVPSLWNDGEVKLVEAKLAHWVHGLEGDMGPSPSPISLWFPNAIKLTGLLCHDAQAKATESSTHGLKLLNP
jgi:hypothetical protein